jgi:hypothetical protein
MLHMKRWQWVGFVVVFALLLTSGVATTQEQEVDDLAEAVRVAQSFDAKYLLPDYIAYSGIEAIARHGLAVYEAATFDAKFFDMEYIAYGGTQDVAQRDEMASFDAKFFDADYIAYSDMQEIARQAPTVHRVGILDQILREQELAQEQFGDALAIDAELHERIANTECFDVKYTLEGSIYCNEQAQIVEEVVEEVDPS